MKANAVLIAGPTASGKSAAAVEIADAIGGAVVNADSMQIYRELSLLTARPGEAEMARVPHHLFGHVGVHEAYSVGRYRADVARVLAELRASGRTPVIVGGTGLYFAALTEGLAEIPAISPEIHEGARAKLAEIGVAALHAELSARDPEAGRALRPSDRQRVLRAYEVFEATGRSILYWQSHAGEPLIEASRAATFVLDVPREELRTRIEARFRQMLASGAAEEAARLADLDPSLPAAKIIGVRELNEARLGRISMDEAVSLAVTRTRQYAKRQVTWFRHRMAGWHWVSSAKGRNFVSEILSRLA